MKVFISIVLILNCFVARAQEATERGIVRDSLTRELLAGVSIFLYKGSVYIGGLTNSEGEFSVNDQEHIDSVRFSAIGYKSLTLKNFKELQQKQIIVQLNRETKSLEEVVVRPMDVSEILRRAIEKIQASARLDNFEARGFYREVIKDSQQYLSVAEAIFLTQIFPEKKSSMLMLIKGRTKEDVSYTKLFEDFHPGGGPQDAISQSLILGEPDFLNPEKIKNFDYKKEPGSRFDGHLVYIIRFDQKPEIREALESGRIFIDGESFDIVKYEARNSKTGTPFIKSLKGSDRIFAGLLHIDYRMRGWLRTVSFREVNGSNLLDHASLEYLIDYKQPSKQLDLHLTIQSEWMTTEFQMPLSRKIGKEEEWKRKNLVANLPSDFDPGFWGTNNILLPTAENRKMIEAISAKNDEQGSMDSSVGWKYMNRDDFLLNGGADSLNLIVLKRCNWEDDQKAGMIYKEIKGDFSIEAELHISRRSNRGETPDNGFQQAGIIVRSGSGAAENSLIFSMGSGGNNKPKIFVKKTSDGKTKSDVEKIDRWNACLKLSRTGNRLQVFTRPDETSDWKELENFEPGWIKDPVQVGFCIMARFAGDGPKQIPDIRASFSKISWVNRNS